MRSFVSICSQRHLGLASAGIGIIAFACRRQIALIASVARYTFMVYIIDILPQQTRRRILAQEYEGEMLEQRLTQRIFKGWATVKALWRMSSINLRPSVNVDDRVPPMSVVGLASGKDMALDDLACADQPLVLNFGSCT